MNTDIKLTECYFIPDKKTSSATICANCGKEKYLHIIGEGVKAVKVNMNTTPMPHTDKQFPKSDADLKDESFARNEKKVFPYTDKQPQTHSEYETQALKLAGNYSANDPYAKQGNHPKSASFHGYANGFLDALIQHGVIAPDWVCCTCNKESCQCNPRHVYKIEYRKSIGISSDSVYIHTPEELVKAFRDVAEKAFQAGEKREYWNNEMEGDSCVPDMKEYLDQHYPLPQPINTNL